jgi:GATA zinc finger
MLSPPYHDSELPGPNLISSESVPTDCRSCVHCGTSSTSAWRRVPGSNDPMCNACGLYIRQRNMFVDPFFFSFQIYSRVLRHYQGCVLRCLLTPMPSLIQRTHRMMGRNVTIVTPEKLQLGCVLFSPLWRGDILNNSHSVEAKKECVYAMLVACIQSFVGGKDHSH